MKNKFKLILFGAFAGLCNGLFGSGGGTIVVPCLEKYASLEEQKAHATAILVILPLSIISLAAYSKGTELNMPAVFAVTGGGIVGSIIGASVLKKLSGTVLRRIFGAFILIAAVRMVMS